MPSGISILLSLFLYTGLGFIIFCALIHGFIAAWDEFNPSHGADLLKQTDADCEEIMWFVSGFGVLLFVTAFAVTFVYTTEGVHQLHPIIINMFTWGMIFYLVPNVVRFLVEALWFIGGLTYQVLFSFYIIIKDFPIIARHLG